MKTRVVCLSLGNTEFEMLARQGKKLASALVVPKGRLVTASTKWERIHIQCTLTMKWSSWDLNILVCATSVRHNNGCCKKNYLLFFTTPKKKRIQGIPRTGERNGVKRESKLAATYDMIHSKEVWSF